MKHIDDIWFSTMSGLIGIVIVEDERTQERKAYIGVGEGHDDKLDIKRIMDFGAPFRIEKVAEIMKAMGAK